MDTEVLLHALQQDAKLEGYSHVQLSPVMGARLSGEGIFAIDPEKQVVSSDQTTEWKWEVQAVRRDEQRIDLALFAFVTIDGQIAPLRVKSFTRRIEVEASWFSLFWAEHWNWIVTVIVLPILFWSTRRFVWPWAYTNYNARQIRNRQRRRDRS
jgi:hypothetical protein